LLVTQACGASADRDQVDRVPDRVVQVTRDAGALFGRGQAAVALGLAVGAFGTVVQLDDVLVVQPHALAGKPRYGPGEPRVQQLPAGKVAVAEPRRDQVAGEQGDDRGAASAGPRLGLRTARREQVQRSGRTERNGDGVAEAGE
jgi:hypothetical protein